MLVRNNTVSASQIGETNLIFAIDKNSRELLQDGICIIPRQLLDEKVHNDTQALSSLISETLKSAHGDNDYYIKDSFDVSRQFYRLSIPPDHIIASLDVVSLFSNIYLDNAVLRTVLYRSLAILTLLDTQVRVVVSGELHQTPLRSLMQSECRKIDINFCNLERRVARKLSGVTREPYGDQTGGDQNDSQSMIVEANHSKIDIDIEESTDQTIHSSHEHPIIGIPITDTPVNYAWKLEKELFLVGEILMCNSLPKKYDDMESARKDLSNGSAIIKFLNHIHEALGAFDLVDHKILEMNGIRWPPFQRFKCYVNNTEPVAEVESPTPVCTKRPTLDRMFASTSQRNDDGLRASYNISLLIANSGKPHTIGEKLILPAVEEVLKTVLHKPASAIVKRIPLSNNTVERRIDEMSSDIESFLCNYLQTTHFSIQLDESTLPDNAALLLAYVRFIMNQEIYEELLFARTLITDTKGESIFHVLKDYFIEKAIPLSIIISVATDGAPAMVGEFQSIDILNDEDF
ncbi:unnamed protein product [Acanthoscelides obtectus]|uniref:Uncharacterized protein n=1 Tax=Acanthoscelides obtectus TaxID=200917 RepID=A0A9P0P7C5_ACAOB|nr:unnamed protein product [Acanthoscelides obtectus]CAK1680379.1 Protein ZBED8 [Acanthoscelides obtectus]